MSTNTAVFRDRYVAADSFFALLAAGWRRWYQHRTLRRQEQHRAAFAEALEAVDAIRHGYAHDMASARRYLNTSRGPLHL